MDWTNSPNSVYFCAYTGASMNPTLRESHLLEIQPYKKQKIRIGDVIFFLPPEGDKLFVHRIIDISPGGIRTRGDNNPQPDACLLTPADIIGKVIAAWHGQTRRKITGGVAGLLLVSLIRSLRMVERKVSSLLRPTYYFFSNTGIIPYILSPVLKPRVVVFQTQSSQNVQLLLGSCIIGQYNSLREQWNIQRPFHLFVDERKLSGFIKTLSRSHVMIR